MSGASVAVIQGASGSIGTAFVRQLLQRSSLNVVATSRDATNARQQILAGPGSTLDPDRLTVLEMDVLREDSIVEAARHVKDTWGKGSLRFLVNVSGVVSTLHEDVIYGRRSSSYLLTLPSSFSFISINRSLKSRWRIYCIRTRFVSTQDRREETNTH